jgi:intein/homing endonuclease
VAFTASPAEFQYYKTFVKPTIESCFGVKGSLYLRKDNTTRYHISGQKLAANLTSIGIPVGKKTDACIPSVVKETNNTISFIRGIYHAEGSIYHRYSKRYNTHARVYDNLLDIQIRMKLKTLMNQIHDELNRSGIATNRLTAKDGVYTLRITRQDMVRNFIELVEPRYKRFPHEQFFNPS